MYDANSDLYIVEVTSVWFRFTFYTVFNINSSSISSSHIALWTKVISKKFEVVYFIDGIFVRVA